MIRTKLTVVIPLYNKAKHILDTLESVLNERPKVAEVIVVDDGSSDEGPLLVKHAIATQACYKAVKLIQQRNGGVSKARNTGIRYATGTHIVCLDADDQWLPGFCAEIHTLIHDFPNCRAFATNYYKKHGDNWIEPKIRFPRPIEQNTALHNYFEISSRGDLPFNTGSICLERTLLIEIGGFPENEPMGEDQDVWAKTALKTAIAYSPTRLEVYILDADNRACIHNPPKTECPFSVRLLAAVESGAFDDNDRIHVLRYTATHLLTLAKSLIAAGDYQHARQLLRDPRCKLLALKKWWLMGMLVSRQLQLRA
ncbi:glycosyltransferase family 2 protein [Teredinibacter purpureus]|uniref:glycosyltransferase family 2 protein n=1 Tax=Teredinibacter purpureus TaxID=2731756 RepID=UPI0005F864FF|nr:glycosyltransferase family 2 protein [Teredinibacter purpureus]